MEETKLDYIRPKRPRTGMRRLGGLVALSGTVLLLVFAASHVRGQDGPGSAAQSAGVSRTYKETGGNQMTEHRPGDWRNFKKPDQATLKKMLSPLQYEVTQKEGTEPPYHNEYEKNHREGIYVDIVSGEPLFSSRDKFDSGTGWPSFSKPLDPGNIVEKRDTSLFMTRTEVRSRHGDSHLGHVFDDGPPPTGLRYCMNSASLRFVPKEDLTKDGYGEYEKIFARK